MRDAGISLQKIRVALENISKLLGKKKNVTDVSIFSDGSSIYILTENDQMIDLLKKGQAVFGISLGPVHTETEAEVFSLFPEKISAENDEICTLFWKLFSEHLDLFNIQWIYEPTSFPLKWGRGAIKMMFTPDFYLPELDVYIEITTMNQNLIKKNKKDKTC